jgi:chaperone required for assembly of F1-ATPase
MAKRRWRGARLLRCTIEPMQDLFTEIFEGEPIDPMEAARRKSRPNLRARFYKSADAGDAGEGGYPVLLDARPIRTPAKALLAAPSRELAQAIAAEWDAQKDVIDPARMPLTRLANAIIDGVVKNPAPVAAEIGKYLGTDLLCYRADEPEGLVAMQAQHWDPVLQWMREEFGARFVLAQGVTFAAQPDQALAAAARAVPKHPWRLGAANSVTTLTGSALLALALAHARIGRDEAWTAANVDEDWNMSQWGRDEQALARRDFRFAEMQAAALVLSTIEEKPE